MMPLTWIIPLRLWGTKMYKKHELFELFIIDPRRACTARFTVLAVSVCRSVSTLAVAWPNYTLKLRYV